MRRRCRSYPAVMRYKRAELLQARQIMLGAYQIMLRIRLRIWLYNLHKRNGGAQSRQHKIGLGLNNSQCIPRSMWFLQSLRSAQSTSSIGMACRQLLIHMAQFMCRHHITLPVRRQHNRGTRYLLRRYITKPHHTSHRQHSL